MNWESFGNVLHEHDRWSGHTHTLSRTEQAHSLVGDKLSDTARRSSEMKRPSLATCADDGRAHDGYRSEPVLFGGRRNHRWLSYMKISATFFFMVSSLHSIWVSQFAN